MLHTDLGIESLTIVRDMFNESSHTPLTNRCLMFTFGFLLLLHDSGDHGTICRDHLEAANSSARRYREDVLRSLEAR